MAQVQDRQGLFDRIKRWLRGTGLAGAVVAVVVIAAVGAVAWMGSSASRQVIIERGSQAGQGADQGLAADTSPPITEDGAAGAPDSQDAGDTASAPEDAGELIVDVGGAVRHPSVVTLSAGSRVRDAIEAAGGLSDDADTTQINQAAPVADGEKVYVPHRGEAVVAPTGSGNASQVDGASGSVSDRQVNINTATVSELDELPGIGPAIAQSIVDDREENGAFSSPEDLMRVSGIGEKKYEKLASLICV